MNRREVADGDGVVFAGLVARRVEGRSRTMGGRPPYSDRARSENIFPRGETSSRSLARPRRGIGFARDDEGAGKIDFQGSPMGNSRSIQYALRRGQSARSILAMTFS